MSSAYSENTGTNMLTCPLVYVCNSLSRKHVLLCWQVYLDSGDNEGNGCELSMRRVKTDGLLRIHVSRLLAAWKLMLYGPQNTVNCSSTNAASHDSRPQSSTTAVRISNFGKSIFVSNSSISQWKMVSTKKGENDSTVNYQVSHA